MAADKWTDRLAQQIAQGGVHTGLATGQAPSTEDGSTWCGVGDRLSHQPTLADPGGAYHGHQPRAAGSRRLRTKGHQCVKLARTADEPRP